MSQSYDSWRLSLLAPIRGIENDTPTYDDSDDDDAITLPWAFAELPFADSVVGSSDPNDPKGEMFSTIGSPVTDTSGGTTSPTSVADSDLRGDTDSNASDFDIQEFDDAWS